MFQQGPMSPCISGDWTFKRRYKPSFGLRLQWRWVEVSVSYLQEQMIEQNKVRICKKFRHLCLTLPMYCLSQELKGGPESSVRMQLTKSKEPRVIQLPTGQGQTQLPKHKFLAPFETLQDTTLCDTSAPQTSIWVAASKVSTKASCFGMYMSEYTAEADEISLNFYFSMLEEKLQKMLPRIVNYIKFIRSFK